jgi:hypothetical protein
VGIDGQRHAPVVLPLGETRYPLYSRPGGPHDRSGRVWKFSTAPEFASRAFQPVRNKYTDCTALSLTLYVTVLLDAYEYRVFPGSKERPWRDADPSPPSSAVGHETVELYLYSPYGLYGLYRASVPVQWCTLPLPYSRAIPLLPL